MAKSYGAFLFCNLLPIQYMFRHINQPYRSIAPKLFLDWCLYFIIEPSSRINRTEPATVMSRRENEGWMPTDLNPFYSAFQYGMSYVARGALLCCNICSFGARKMPFYNALNIWMLQRRILRMYDMGLNMFMLSRLLDNKKAIDSVNLIQISVICVLSICVQTNTFATKNMTDMPIRHLLYNSNSRTK